MLGSALGFLPGEPMHTGWHPCAEVLSEIASFVSGAR
jgi:hypothetical protein